MKYARRTILVILAACFVGCTPEPKEPPPLELDGEYLESEAYREFSSNLQRESDRRTDEQELINRAVQEVLRRTERDLELPARFTTESIGPYTAPERRILLKSQGITSSDFGHYSYYPVGKVEHGALNVLFFLLRRNNTPFIDMDLMAATVDGEGAVRSALSLAPYRKAGGEWTRSEITVSPDLEITSRIRDSGSGVIQDGSVRYREFIIAGDGEIIEDPSFVD